jgi:hypothetical protein
MLLGCRTSTHLEVRGTKPVNEMDSSIVTKTLLSDSIILIGVT